MSSMPTGGAMRVYAQANQADEWEQKLRTAQAQKKYNDLKSGRSSSSSSSTNEGGDRWSDAEKALGMRQREDSHNREQNFQYRDKESESELNRWQRRQDAMEAAAKRQTDQQKNDVASTKANLDKLGK